MENANTIEEVVKKSLEPEFFIAICRHTGVKWQLKTLFLSIFDPLLLIVDIVFDCCLPSVRTSVKITQYKRFL